MAKKQKTFVVKTTRSVAEVLYKGLRKIEGDEGVKLFRIRLKKVLAEFDPSLNTGVGMRLNVHMAMRNKFALQLEIPQVLNSELVRSCIRFQERLQKAADKARGL